LAAFGDPGPGGNIATAVESVVADANAPLWLRCVAARALGSFKYTKYAADARLNPSEAARKLGEFAVAACRNELDRIEEARRREQERQLAKSGGFSMFRGAAPAGGGPVGSPAAGAENPAAAGAGDPAAGAGDPAAGAGDPAAAGDPMAGAGGPTAGMAGGTPGGAGPARSPAESASAEEVAKVDLTRRRLKYHLFCVRSGLTGHGDRKKITPQQEGEKLGGVMILTDPSNRGFVEQVIGAVDAVDEVLDVKADAVEEASVTLETITQELRNKVNELTSSLSPAGVAAEGAPGPAPADQPDTDAPGGGKTPPSTPPGKKTPAAMSGVKAATGNVPTGKKPAGKSAGGAAPSGKKPAGKAPTGKPAKK
jgi:hypothetical protein